MFTIYNHPFSGPLMPILDEETKPQRPQKSVIKIRELEPVIKRIKEGKISLEVLRYMQDIVLQKGWDRIVSIFTEIMLQLGFSPALIRRFVDKEIWFFLVDGIRRPFSVLNNRVTLNRRNRFVGYWITYGPYISHYREEKIEAADEAELKKVLNKHIFNDELICRAVYAAPMFTIYVPSTISQGVVPNLPVVAFVYDMKNQRYVNILEYVAEKVIEMLGVLDLYFLYRCVFTYLDRHLEELTFFPQEDYDTKIYKNTPENIFPKTIEELRKTGSFWGPDVYQMAASELSVYI